MVAANRGPAVVAAIGNEENHLQSGPKPVAAQKPASGRVLHIVRGVEEGTSADGALRTGAGDQHQDGETDPERN